MQNNAEDLTIHYARYGSVVDKRDVLEIIDDQVSPYDRLALLVNNDNLGGDFYSGVVKQLHIIYTFNGVLCEERIDEGGMLVIPKPSIVEIVEGDNVLLDSIGIAVIAAALFWGISQVVRSWKNNAS